MIIYEKSWWVTFDRGAGCHVGAPSEQEARDLASTVFLERFVTGCSETAMALIVVPARSEFEGLGSACEDDLT